MEAAAQHSTKWNLTLLGNFANDLEWQKVIVTRGNRKHDMDDVDIPVLPTHLSIKSEGEG